MNYTFSLSRNRLVIIAVGLFLIGSLLFSAGLVIGLYVNPPATASSTNPSPNNVTQAVVSISTPAPTPASTPAASMQTKTTANVNKNDAPSAKPVEAKTTETEKVADKSEPSRNPDNKKGFVVKIGEFADLPEAQLLVYQLELKGYIPRISEIRDAQRRVKYVVLLGSYLYEADAKKSAALFSEQERVQAESMLMNLF